VKTVDPFLYRRFWEESRGRLDPGLRAWAGTELLAGLSYSARVAERDRHLRAAGGFFSDLTVAERARRLRAALLRVRRGPKPSHPDSDELEGCLALALLARDHVPGVRALRRILAGQNRI
jgi:hypothetical protein